MSIFLQHAVIAAIGASGVVFASLIGVAMNRKMTRIEIAVNGRIESLLAEIKRQEEQPGVPKEEP